MKLKLAAACLLATIAFQAKAHPSCGEGGRNAFREYRDKLQPMISARVRSLWSDASIERINIVSLSIRKDGVVTSSEIAKPSGSPQFDAKLLSMFPAGLQLPPLPACYKPNLITLMFPIRFRPDRPF
ncbi:energy transducer TonB [Methylorubrum extorquens]|uniref:energy transducer TonB family protein n=1 Tax=Methylorubrum extorquens TaxID=408 RepID=UPI000972DD4D|nr:energy transducer TonB [Methylorubrum extorquens]APX85808.1 energy transducer TonB [Methylorubrum extorquens]